MQIHLLSEDTINKIAAGEVVERPVSVVKELIENSIDAGASAITIEIREGGIKQIRVTDNGRGIAPGDVRMAFARHATSKIRDERDLSRLSSLGFRGEALSSIASVSQVEMITKTAGSLTGIRATNIIPNRQNEQSAADMDLEEIGAPDGTSIVIRNLFYNVPVRRKFLKRPQTEAGYVTDLVEKQALSHPGISFHYRVDGRDKLHTTGSGDLRELLLRIYGRELRDHLVPVQYEEDGWRLEGFAAKPQVNRSTRSFEVFFVNGRMLRSNLLSKALEEGYGTDLMQHRFPFAVLHLSLPPAEADVNVHPSKMEVRFTQNEDVYHFVSSTVARALKYVERIHTATVEPDREQRQRLREEKRDEEQKLQDARYPEPFERNRMLREGITPYGTAAPATAAPPAAASRTTDVFFSEDGFVFEDKRAAQTDAGQTDAIQADAAQENAVPADAGQAEVFFRDSMQGTYHQASLFPGTDLSAEDPDFILAENNLPQFRIIGQVFRTYWLIEYDNKLLMIDQHAAHEKVNYERLMKRLESKQTDKNGTASQLLMPPAVVTLTGREEGELTAHRDVFLSMGYELESLGGMAYAIRAVPLELYGNDPCRLLQETLEEMVSEKIGGTPQAILSKIASMSCKAAVKGNSLLSEREAKALIEDLLQLDNPYHCPHGRPTMIVFSQYDIDRKFKRIL
ncbi:MAG: DNA mismatch repair endonuclease MutL [Eubacteriales bacterium]|nr:DNA mismatch repair endonuclease MutL [Eubacteriales bacterium]